MTATDHDLAVMVQTLEQSGEYRVLRRLPFRQHFSTPIEPTKVGILFDVETTGLDTASDEVVELGMVKFSYHPDGTVAAVLDTFSSFTEPSGAIPEEAIKLHGICRASRSAASRNCASPEPEPQGRSSQSLSDADAASSDQASRRCRRGRQAPTMRRTSWCWCRVR
jgi:hypothetical protein